MKTSKNFFPMHASTLFKRLTDGWVPPHVYEIIYPTNGVRMHLDFDISPPAELSLPPDEKIQKNMRDTLNMLGMGYLNLDLNEVWDYARQEVTEAECELAYKFAMRVIQRGFNEGLLIDDQEILCLSGCRPDKISFHFSCVNHPFDCNVCSVAMFAWELKTISEEVH
jgi:hypothetical protein